LGDHVVGNGETHNLAITKQFNGKVEGLKSLVDLQKKVFLGRYTGDILTEAEMRKRQKEEPVDRQYCVVLQERVKYICGKYNGNVLKMINNHCTKPNCILMKYTDHEGNDAIGIWTSRFIHANEDLYYTYGFDQTVKWLYPKIKCLCAGLDKNRVPNCKTNL